MKCLHAHLAWHLAGGDDPVGRWTAGQLAVHDADFVMESEAVREDAGPVAAVDCGTNSTRLIVMAPDGTVLDRQMRITRLGEGVDAARALAPNAIERTLAVLREYRAAMDARGARRVRVAATSAVRDAANAEVVHDERSPRSSGCDRRCCPGRMKAGCPSPAPRPTCRR